MPDWMASVESRSPALQSQLTSPRKLSLQPPKPLVVYFPAATGAAASAENEIDTSPSTEQITRNFLNKFFIINKRFLYHNTKVRKILENVF